MENNNIEQAKQKFIKYVENYDLTKKSIKSKLEHSLRVMELSEKIAVAEGLTSEEIEIATLIGLLHDIARFKQYTEFKTFSDNLSFDHGEVGVEILKTNNYIREYISNNKFDETIMIAIKNHNKLQIEKGLTEEQNKFSKIIRDADKIDILFQASQGFWNVDKNEMEQSEINLEIKNDFDKKQTIDRTKYPEILYANSILQIIGLVFDINYKSSFEIIQQEKYIEKIVDQFDYKNENTKIQLKDAKEKANDYILDKIKEV